MLQKQAVELKQDREVFEAVDSYSLTQGCPLRVNLSRKPNVTALITVQSTKLLSNNQSKSIIWSIKHSDHSCNSPTNVSSILLFQITLHCWLISVFKLVWICPRAEAIHTPFWNVLVRVEISSPKPRNYHLENANNFNQSVSKIPKIRRHLCSIVFILHLDQVESPVKIILGKLSTISKLYRRYPPQKHVLANLPNIRSYLRDN